MTRKQKNPRQALGDLIREDIEKRDTTITHLAEALEVHRVSMSNLVNASGHWIPSFLMLIKLKQALGWSEKRHRQAINLVVEAQTQRQLEKAGGAV